MPLSTPLSHHTKYQLLSPLIFTSNNQILYDGGFSLEIDALLLGFSFRSVTTVTSSITIDAFPLLCVHIHPYSLGRSFSNGRQLAATKFVDNKGPSGVNNVESAIKLWKSSLY